MDQVEAKKHHYVPKFYLKAFARTRGKRRPKHFLFVRDLREHRVYQDNIDNVAAARHFNTYRDHRGEVVDGEAWTRDADDAQSRTLEKVRKRRDLSTLTAVEYMSLMAFIAFTYFRGVRTRDILEHHQDFLLDGVRTLWPDDADQLIRKYAFDASDVKAMHFAMMADVGGVVTLRLATYRSRLLRPPRGVHLPTSDSPVLFLKGPHEHVGLALAPDLFLALDRQSLDERVPGVGVMTPSGVDFYKWALCRAAHQRVFAGSPSWFEGVSDDDWDAEPVAVPPRAWLKTIDPENPDPRSRIRTPLHHAFSEAWKRGERG